MPKSHVSFEEYLSVQMQKGVYQFRIAPETTPDGVKFLIHPLGVDGETRDFVVVASSIADVTRWLPEANVEQADPPKIDDYVLATKYDDGDPNDHWFVGFLHGFTESGRYLVADNHGRDQRAGGFRRAEKITGHEGRVILNQAKAGYQSVWDLLAEIRKKNESTV